MAARVVVGLTVGAAFAWAHAEAAICEITGQPAPDVRTLVGAYVVNPNCSYEEVPGAFSSGPITLDISNVERVESVPKNAKMIFTWGGLSRGANFSAAEELSSLYIVSATSISDLVFPGSTSEISLQKGTVKDIDKLRLPEGLLRFSVVDTTLQSFKDVKLPATLKELNLQRNQVTDFDFDLPPSLTSFSLSWNPVTKVERHQFPEKLLYFNCEECKLSSVRGVNFPRTIISMSLGEIASFEMREYDLPVLKKSYGKFVQTSCTDPTAKLVAFDRGNACVISDDRFTELYGIALPPPTAAPSPAPTASPTSSPAPDLTTPSPDDSPATPSPSSTDSPPLTPPSSTSGSSGLTSAQEAAIRSAGSSISSTKAPKASSTVAVGNTTPPVNNVNKTSSTGATRAPTASGKTSGAHNANPIADASNTDQAADGGAGSDKATDGDKSIGTTVKAAGSSTTSTLVLVICVVGTATALLVGALVCRAAAGPRRKDVDDSETQTDTFMRLESPSQGPSTAVLSTEPRSQEFLENDIRNDALLATFRIEGSAIRTGAPIAQGGFGIIYKGVVDGETVAIKKMLPDTWRDEATVANFMDEIRMCVSLDHPKIVHCVGISWSSLRDLSVISEYMTGGDLHTLLQSQSNEPTTGREWSEPWTASSIKSKTSIAADVAEAIAYLHAFSTPIIHRDLKAKNVLLDTEGNAKLSDFGISREVSMDETMTREIGTVAWIAPEVLRGERYSEKADIYSLGVLLVELDRCAHPYAQVLDANEDGKATGGGQAVVKNTRIAILVSAGKLRPTLSPTCPEPVVQLVERCLSFEAAQRPSAQEVFGALGAM